MAELLYQAVMKVPTLTGTWQQRNAQLYAKLGGSSKYGAYQGNLAQNSWLINQINSNDYFNSWSAPAQATPAPVVAPVGPPPSTSAELADYLNKQQTELEAIKNYDPFDGGTASEKIEGFAKDTLGIEGEAPVAPKYEETFNKLRMDMGLDTVESSINEYKSMIRDQENLLMQQKNTERGKTNRLGVIEGRVDQATRDRQEQISWLSSNVSYLTDVANNAYNYISMTMNFKQMDYNTAKEEYDSEFNKRMGIYNTLVSEAKDERNFQLSLKQEQQKTASVQLSMYADMISSGQRTWASMNADEQMQVHKLEVQAGLPVGFTSKIQIPKGSTIKSVTNWTDTNGNMYAGILYVDPITGKSSVENQLIGNTPVAKTSSGGSSSSSAKNSYGYTTSQWSILQQQARTKLTSLEGDLQLQMYNEGTVKTKSADQVLGDWEYEKILGQFRALYGQAGEQLLIDSLNAGGYKSWDYNLNKAVSGTWG